MLDKTTIKILYAITHYLHKNIELDNDNWRYRFKIALRLWWQLMTMPDNMFTSARMRGLCMFINPYTKI